MKYTSESTLLSRLTKGKGLSLTLVGTNVRTEHFNLCLIVKFRLLPDVWLSQSCHTHH